MKNKDLENLLKVLTGKKKLGQDDGGPSKSMEEATLHLHPLTVGFRVDVSVPVGAGDEAEASQFIWVSPTGSLRSVKALKVLLSPN